MARHADTPGRELDDAAVAADAHAPVTDQPEAHTCPSVEATEAAEFSLRQGVSTTGAAIGIGAIGALLVGGVCGWHGYQAYQAGRLQAQDAVFVQAGRQAALNLTTIDYTEADADIRRILDSATGTFHDDFQQRSQPFIDLVKQTQSKSEGTITEAALESQHPDQANVLVAVSVKTSLGAAPQQDAPIRAWRMRIGLQLVDQVAKVADVQFVP